MKRIHKIAAGIAISLSLGLATSAFAHPGWGPQMRGGGYGMMGGFGPGAMAGAGYGAPLMSPEERTAFWEKMQKATTPEERQKLMAEHRAEVQKRAEEKGVTPRGGYGPGAGYGRGAGLGPATGFGPGNGPCWMQRTSN